MKPNYSSIMHAIKATAPFLFLLTGSVVYGQTPQQKALELGNKAVALEDNGKYDEAIELLQDAAKLDPASISYPYELGYACYKKNDYKKAAAYLKALVGRSDVYDQIFQLLGNVYDNMGESQKALDTYDEGLKKFPTSGKLFLEKGNVYWGKKDYAAALPYYERGIEADPAFPSNYYRAARIFCSTTEEVWGMIYGEIFMNLERNSERTAEISKLLYDTYKSEIKITSDTSITVSFSQQMTMNADAFSDPKNVRLPFGMIYEPTLLLSAAGEKSIDIDALDRIRTNFVNQYFGLHYDNTHPNILFDYQNRVLKAGHLEAYNHWILMKGDEDGFNRWKSGNDDKWQAFIKWFTDNGLTVDAKNKFYRNQY